ncbi:MAG TPA: TolC family protein [Bryobacteraceae bacterium]|nr:TolC family protein [Bryobacteraceae bacterium]
MCIFMGSAGLGSQIVASAQTSTPLTLAQAEALALKNHPRIASAGLNAEAAGKVVNEARSAYFPIIAANVTGADAVQGTTVAAGALTTSSLSTRFASGMSLLQMVTDFGRTSHLVRSSRLRAEAANDNVALIRAEVLLDVRVAYFAALGSEAVRKAAQAALDNRRLSLRQVTALSQSSLKSTLDVSFAQVLVSEAELAVYQAESDVAQSQAHLAAALGLEHTQPFTLADEPLPPALNPAMQVLIDAALRDRPDLNLLRRNNDAADEYTKAERKLNYPTVNVMGAAGVIPEHDATLAHDNYGAAGININIPVFNGGLFSARRSEAALRAQAANKDVQDLSVRISREVQDAWLQANTSYRRLSVTAQLVNQANQALHLAQARYDAGLGSIVELNQAQLAQTSAEIDAASAKYEYLSARAALDYATGVLR